MFNAPRSLQVTASFVAAAHEALGSRRRAVEVSAAHALQAAQCDAIPLPFSKQYQNNPCRMHVAPTTSLQRPRRLIADGCVAQVGATLHCKQHSTVSPPPYKYLMFPAGCRLSRRRCYSARGARLPAVFAKVSTAHALQAAQCAALPPLWLKQIVMLPAVCGLPPALLLQRTKRCSASGSLLR